MTDEEFKKKRRADLLRFLKVYGKGLSESEIDKILDAINEK